MTSYEVGSPFITSEASNTSMFRTTAIGAGPRDSDPIFPSPFRVWARVLRAFDSMLAEPLKTWMRLVRDVAELRGLDDRGLRDILFSRVDVAATKHAPGSPTVRWDERPPARHDLHAAPRGADTERPMLIAQWFIAADGRLVCHWQLREQRSAARESTPRTVITDCVV
jgi:uncharacterized protein YjiS (DUF1127 family)